MPQNEEEQSGRYIQWQSAPLSWLRIVCILTTPHVHCRLLHVLGEGRCVPCRPYSWTWPTIWNVSGCNDREKVEMGHYTWFFHLSAQTMHIPGLLRFCCPKYVTWPHLTPSGWEGTILPYAQKEEDWQCCLTALMYTTIPYPGGRTLASDKACHESLGGTLISSSMRLTTLLSPPWAITDGY